ncbi:MAG: DUF1015 family protein [Deltaproteobacteria bacterium]|nr:DUF1015 family protein [Deltaproteobacteria bacterium]
MPQIAGLRGVLPDPSKLAEVLAAPSDAFAERLASGALNRDPGRAVYRYHQVFELGGRTVTRKALIAAVRLMPWSERQIRAHEESGGRDAALATIRATGAHTVPVFAGFRDAAGEVDRQFRKLEGDRPTLQHTTADGTIHRVFRAQSAEILGPLRKVFAPKKLHVLDGHDRYEAMLAYQEELGAKQALPLYSSANHGLACMVNLDDPTVYQTTTARHRIVRGPAVKSAAVLAAAKPWFIIDKLAGAAKDQVALRAALADSVAHQPAFVIVFAGEPDAYKLTLSPDVSLIDVGVKVHRALQKLDPVVEALLFRPRALAGATVTTDTDLPRVLAAVQGGAAAAIVMRPMQLDQLIHVDELGELLPAGSTAFFPPVAAGLVMSMVDPDEDLV